MRGQGGEVGRSSMKNMEQAGNQQASIIIAVSGERVGAGQASDEQVSNYQVNENQAESQGRNKEGWRTLRAV